MDLWGITQSVNAGNFWLDSPHFAVGFSRKHDRRRSVARWRRLAASHTQGRNRAHRNGHRTGAICGYGVLPSPKIVELPIRIQQRLK